MFEGTTDQSSASITWDSEIQSHGQECYEGDDAAAFRDLSSIQKLESHSSLERGQRVPKTAQCSKGRYISTQGL